MNLCKCGCGKEVTKKTNTFLHGHNIDSITRSKIIKEMHKKWKKQNPEKYKQHQKQAGRIGGKKSYQLNKETIIKNVKKFHKKNPDFASKTLKKTRKKHPDIFLKASSKGGKNYHNRMKKQNPEEYKLRQSKASKKANEKMNSNPKYREIRSRISKNFHRENPNFFKEIMKKTQKEWKQKDPIGYHEHHVKIGKISHKKNPNLVKENALKTHKIIRKNKPYIWKGVHFMSRNEMEVAKLLLIEPIAGINCHVKINGKIIDFFPQDNDLQFQNCFVEYHPWDWCGRTIEKYTADRKQIIENSEYRGTSLIVITDINAIN